MPCKRPRHRHEATLGTDVADASAIATLRFPPVVPPTPVATRAREYRIVFYKWTIIERNYYKWTIIDSKLL